MRLTVYCSTAELIRNQENDAASAVLQEALLSVAGTSKGEISERGLGNKFKSFKNRIEQGYRLETAGERQGTTLWRVIQAN